MNIPLIEKDARSYLELAGFKVDFIWETLNPYWRYRYLDAERRECAMGSAYLLRTEHGIIRIGWRKRVMEVDWESTKLRKIVDKERENETTSMQDCFHAYNVVELIQRLQELKKNFEEFENGN